MTFSSNHELLRKKSKQAGGQIFPGGLFAKPLEGSETIGPAGRTACKF